MTITNMIIKVTDLVKQSINEFKNKTSIKNEYKIYAVLFFR